jgi:hypothetical protein
VTLGSSKPGVIQNTGYFGRMGGISDLYIVSRNNAILSLE